MLSILRGLQHRNWHWHISYGWTQGFLQQLYESAFFLDKHPLSISRVYQGLQEAQLDLSAAVLLDRTCRLRSRGYSQLCIFCRERYFSRFLLSFISLPYLPTVPSSDRIKWECCELAEGVSQSLVQAHYLQDSENKGQRSFLGWLLQRPVCALQSSGPHQKVLLATKSYLPWRLNLSSFTFYFSMDGYVVP